MWSAPLIGVTTYLDVASAGVWTVSAAFLPASYVDAVTRAGGIAVLLPPQPTSRAVVARILDGLDGVVLTGGRDIDPARYGQVPHPRTDSPRRGRDAWEAELLEQAIERDLPFFGICRGAQLLNVVRGGTLHQHLPDVVDTDSYDTGDGVYGRVDVVLSPGSLLHDLIGADAPLASASQTSARQSSARQSSARQVPVYHHQAIDELGAGLTVTARAADGIIQAVELQDATFGVAVQWHPEEQTEDIRLFAGLVAAAARYRTLHAVTTGRMMP